MIKFKKTKSLYYFIAVFLAGKITCSSGEEILTTKDIRLEEYPSYFSTETWEEINRVNSILNKPGVEKIVAVVDSPVEYVGGLKGKKDKSLQRQIDEGLGKYSNAIDGPYHGTAVMGLIVSKPIKAPCYFDKDFSSQSCSESEIVVSGIAQHIKTVSVVLDKVNTNNILEELIDNINPLSRLTDEEKKKIRNLKKKFPTIVILNCSFGAKGKKENLNARIKEHIDSAGSTTDIAFHRDVISRWAKDYIEDNKTNWKPILSKDEKKKEKKLMTIWNDIKNEIDKYAKEYDKAFEKYNEDVKSTMDYISFYSAGSVLVVTAAGNDHIELKPGEFGISYRYSSDPIITSGAGCGKNYKGLCSWSNFGNNIVDILAPGEHIPVAIPIVEKKRKVHKATYASGTSFSSPVVAGVAALLAQCNPDSSAQDIKKMILESAYEQDGLKGSIINGKFLNAMKVLKDTCQRKGAPRPKKPEIEKNDL